MASQLTTERVTEALATVNDPEIHKPITELDMVKSVDIEADGTVRVGVYLTVAGCPMKDTITKRVTEAVSRLDGVTSVQVDLDVMSEEQRKDLQTKLRGGQPAKEIPFAKPNSLTKVYAVASGKGGGSACSPPGTSRSCGAGRCCTARSSSSSRTSTGATSTSC